jgi:hypothetical protein
MGRPLSGPHSPSTGTPGDALADQILRWTQDMGWFRQQKLRPAPEVDRAIQVQYPVGVQVQVEIEIQVRSVPHTRVAFAAMAGFAPEHQELLSLPTSSKLLWQIRMDLNSMGVGFQLLPAPATTGAVGASSLAPSGPTASPRFGGITLAREYFVNEKLSIGDLAEALWLIYRAFLHVSWLLQSAGEANAPASKYMLR